MQIFSNNSFSTLASPLNVSQLSILVADGSSFPTINSPDYCLVTVEYLGTLEIIKVIGKSGNTLIIDPLGRAVEGTTASYFPLGARVELRITAGSLYTIADVAGSLVQEEASTRGVMDTSLINNISTLTSSVSTVSTNLSTEITNRTSAISSEATARTTADGVLQAAITAEESSRIAQDTILANNINTFAPTGAVAYFATKTPSYQPPTGWLECDGSSGLSTTGLYASLFAVIGYTFGGAGAVFSIPDLRGEFIRGWNRAGTGLDPGRAFGSSQTDSLKDHTHTYNAMTVRSGNPYGGASLMYDTIPVATASSSATPSGAETRPHNVALLACIKY